MDGLLMESPDELNVPLVVSGIGLKDPKAKEGFLT